MAEKRRMVALTRLPGASVARVARENGINANQLYAWKRLEARGRLGGAAESAALVAVRAAPESGEMAARGGCLELEHGRGRLRVEPGADAVLLRIVLEHLVGRSACRRKRAFGLWRG